MARARPSRRALLAGGLAGGLAGLAAPRALACGFENATPLRVLAPDHAAWRAVSAAMAACGAVEVTLDAAVRDRLAPALSSDPAAAHIAGVASDTIVPLLQAGSLRPLDDLVAAHGGGLLANQLVRVDRQTMAIAMAVDTRHMMVRQDIFDDLGLAPPATWADALAAADAIRRAGVVDHPMGVAMAPGWDLAQGFVDMALGYGGTLVDAEGQPAVASEAGQRALAMMRATMPYLGPEPLAQDTEAVARALREGRIAMAVLWARQAAAMDDPARSQVVGQIATSAAPRVTPAGPPAATLWWEGIAIARALPDAEADAAFRVAMAGLGRATARDHGADAIWLIAGYRPTRLAAGALATAAAEPAPAAYPSTPQMALMHAALGRALPGYFSAAAAAEDTLAAAAADYTTAARAAGLID